MSVEKKSNARIANERILKRAATLNATWKAKSFPPISFDEIIKLKNIGRK